MASAGFGLIYGAIGVAGVAWVLEDAQPGLAGPIFAVIFAGGLIGDLLLAPRRAGLPIRPCAWAMPQAQPELACWSRRLGRDQPSFWRRLARSSP